MQVRVQATTRAVFRVQVAHGGEFTDPLARRCRACPFQVMSGPVNVSGLLVRASHTQWTVGGSDARRPDQRRPATVPVEIRAPRVVGDLCVRKTSWLKAGRLRMRTVT